MKTEIKVQVLGSGCPTCKSLYASVKSVVDKLRKSNHKLNIDVEYSTDITRIVELGLMHSPVLVVNGKIISAGGLPSNDEIEKAILLANNDNEKSN